MIVLGVVLLLVFLLGRATGGASSDEIETLQARVESLQAQNDQLEAAARANASVTPSPVAPAPVASPSPASDGTGTGTGTGTTPSPSPSPPSTTSSTTLPAEYTVESGETFSSISRDFYGSSAFASCIQQANEYDSPTSLQAGDDITIPEKPANPCT